jgi:hypothetical protein
MRAALALALSAGCYHPAYEDCQIACPDNLCPSGLSCVAGMCRTTTGPCGGGGSADAAETGAWKYRKRIVLPPVPEEVREFPLLVNRVDPDLANRANVDGSDIKFTTIEGTKLAHEIESYDKANGHLIAWVRVPIVLTGGTELYMYYGNPMAAAQANPAGVWDAEYLAVWHLSDPSGGTVADSTSVNIDGTKAAPNAPASFPAGQIGGSLSFSATASNLVGMVGPNTVLDSSSMTFEAWLRRDAATDSSFHRLYERPATFATGITIGYPSDALPGVLVQSLFVETAKNGNPVRLQSEAQSLVTNTWTHIAVTTDGNTPTLYINGVSRTLTAFSANLPHENSGVTIGGRLTAAGVTADSISGLLDEVRVSKSVRSSGYVSISFLSQSKPDFLTFGPAESVTP